MRLPPGLTKRYTSRNSKEFSENSKLGVYNDLDLEYKYIINTNTE
uniref:Uncharacterized protein n=1 Tax=Rhizobium phage IG49 TaxID=3129228 RepID=A0AAU8HZI6_9CAUD